MDVVVQIPAFQEGQRLTETAEQIVAQPTPEFATVDVEAWVTLSPPDRSLCTTWQAAMDARGVDTFEAPRGKLTARNAAHDAAVERGYDVIVTWDADAPPLREDTLTRLLEPLTDAGVVATNSRPIAERDPSFIDWGIDLFSGVEDTVRPHMHGQCHSMTAAAWQQAGPFETGLDETSLNEVRAEEEFDFRRRLSAVGEVVDTDALVFNDPRRTHCYIPGMGEDAFCDRRGVETFQPFR